MKRNVAFLIFCSIFSYAIYAIPEKANVIALMSNIEKRINYLDFEKLMTSLDEDRSTSYLVDDLVSYINKIELLKTEDMYIVDALDSNIFQDDLYHVRKKNDHHTDWVESKGLIKLLFCFNNKKELFAILSVNGFFIDQKMKDMEPYVDTERIEKPKDNIDYYLKEYPIELQTADSNVSYASFSCSGFNTYRYIDYGRVEVYLGKYYPLVLKEKKHLFEVEEKIRNTEIDQIISSGGGGVTTYTIQNTKILNVNIYTVKDLKAEEWILVINGIQYVLNKIEWEYPFDKANIHLIK